MDATYNTTTIIFICATTNIGYCVVAEFLVQSESAECIQEAISVLQQWNPDWSPEFFMSDFCEAEIQALESAFPNSLCTSATSIGNRRGRDRSVINIMIWMNMSVLRF